MAGWSVFRRKFTVRICKNKKSDKMLPGCSAQ